MSDIKNEVQGIDPSAKPRDIKALIGETQNVYETLSIIGKRASQLAVDPGWYAELGDFFECLRSAFNLALKLVRVLQHEFAITNRHQ